MWYQLSKVTVLAQTALIGIAAFGLVAASPANAEIKIGSKRR